MSNSNGGILNRKILAGSVRHSKSLLENSLFELSKKTISKVFLEVMRAKVDASVLNIEIRTTCEAVSEMSSELFGAININDEITLVGFNAEYINSVIKLLTGSKTSQPSTRTITSTDIELTRFTLNKIIEELHSEFEASPNITAEFINDKAHLSHIFLEDQFAHLQVTIRNTDNKSIGEIEIAIPLGTIDKLASLDNESQFGNLEDGWRASLQRIAVNSRLNVTTVVSRTTIPLRTAMRFEAGQLIELTDASLKNLTMESPDIGKPKTIFEGKLGALSSQKAFKITNMPCPKLGKIGNLE